MTAIPLEKEVTKLLSDDDPVTIDFMKGFDRYEEADLASIRQETLQAKRIKQHD